MQTLWKQNLWNSTKNCFGRTPKKNDFKPVKEVEHSYSELDELNELFNNQVQQQSIPEQPKQVEQIKQPIVEEIKVRNINGYSVTDYDDSIPIIERTEIPKITEKKRLFGFLSFKKYKNKG